MSKKQKPNQQETQEVKEPVAEQPQAEEVVEQEPVVETQEPVAEVQDAPEPIPEPSVETPAAPAPVQAAPVEVAPVTEAPKVVTEVSEAEAYLDNIRTKGTEVQKRMLAAIETFADRLRPKVEIDPVKGSGYQVEFLEHLLWLLGKEDFEEFRKGWNVLLVYFNLYHGVNTASNYTALSEFSTTRFLHAWTKGEIKSNAYRRLITLLRATRDPATRKHSIMTIDLGKVGEDLFTEVELNNLKRFYGV